MVESHEMVHVGVGDHRPLDAQELARRERAEVSRSSRIERPSSRRSTTTRVAGRSLRKDGRNTVRMAAPAHQVRVPRPRVRTAIGTSTPVLDPLVPDVLLRRRIRRPSPRGRTPAAPRGSRAVTGSRGRSYVAGRRTLSGPVGGRSAWNGRLEAHLDVRFGSLIRSQPACSVARLQKYERTCRTSASR